MDISVFNLLMSTTPNVSDVEASAVDIRAQAVQAQDSLRTGEAFLEVLEQVRSGKTEKSAETFFNTMSARADASSSLKSFKTNEKYGENVKVVKLHIKRTRASEKLQKAEEKTTTAPETVQNRQKIPNRENIAATQETKMIDYEENGLQTVDNPSFTPATDVSNQTEPERGIPVFSDELTAADILVGIALQPTAVQETNIQPQTVEDASPVTKEQEQPLLPTEQTETPQIAKNNEATDVPTKKTPTPQAQKNEPAEKQNVSFLQNEETLSLPVDLEAKDFSPVERLNVQNSENDFVPFKENNTRQDLPVSVSTEKTTEKLPVRESHVLKERTSTVRPADISTDFSVETETSAPALKSESRRQADQLAAALPTNTKIAITVQTGKPTATVFGPVRLSDDKNTTERKTASEKNAETPLFETSHFDLPQDERIPVRPVETQTASDDSVKPQTERQPAQNLTNNMIPLPVEQKSFSDTTQTSAGTVSSSGAVNTSATNTPTGQAFIPAGQELKGKAVSGTTALPKHIPVNELADQIKINIKKAVKAGLDKIDVVLKHKDLGTIKVHLEIDKEGNMKAVLSTARTETLDLLRSDLQGLKQALADGGFNMNDESFSFNYRGERYDDEQKQPKPHHTDNIAANDDEEENYLQPISATDHSGRSALNIRV